MRNIKIIFLPLLLLFQNCSENISTSDKTVEINGVIIPENILSEIKNDIGKEPIKFEQVNYTYDSAFVEKIDTVSNGFYFSKISEKKAKEIVKKYKSVCAEHNNYIFLKDLSFDDNWNILYDITIIKASDQYEVLKIMNTQGVNYDVSNDLVIKKIKEWDSLVGLSIVVAQEDRVEAYIEKLPNDIDGFTNQVYTLCPDVIDQGYGDMEEMIKDYKENKYLWMWWD